MKEFYHKHYIRLDGNKIIKGFSDAFEQPLESDVCINEQGGYQFRLFVGGIENPALINMQGCHNYKYAGGTVKETAAEEKQAELAGFPKPEPTADELQAEQNIDFDYRLSLMELGI